jgi:hypothetical protein
MRLTIGSDKSKARTQGITIPDLQELTLKLHSQRVSESNRNWASKQESSALLSSLTKSNIATSLSDALIIIAVAVLTDSATLTAAIGRLADARCQKPEQFGFKQRELRGGYQ